jgi:hypothetical protein
MDERVNTTTPFRAPIPSRGDGWGLARTVARVATVAAVTVALLGMLVAPAFADPTPFATATYGCTGAELSTLTFPVQSSGHPDVIYSVTSTGASGSAQGNGGNDGLNILDFNAGDVIWGATGPVSAGTAPTLDVSCSGGSVLVGLYDRATAPVTISGVSSGDDSSSLPFYAVGAGQFVLDARIDQGAITIGPSLTINSSGEYSLGSLPAGDNYYSIEGSTGPTAHYSLTVRELPVQISGQSFGSARYAAPGTILTGSFSVSGDTTITAYVTNAVGQVIRNLGSFGVPEGASSITWDTRGTSGASLPDGTYYLVLESTDPNGNVTSAKTSIVIDGTPPTARMTSPGTIRPSQSISFSVTDADSGVGSISLLVDGQDIEDFGGYSGNSVPANGSFSYAGPWSLGRHSWQIEDSDNVGNQSDVRGSFSVANPPHATRMPVLTGVSGPLQVRPYIVDLTADGSQLLGGVTGRHPHENTPGKPFGRLHWITWNSSEGRASGAEWLNNCRPSCARGTYHAYKATVHVYDPGRSSVFLRMTVKSHRSFTYSASYFAADGGGWGWR